MTSELIGIENFKESIFGVIILTMFDGCDFEENTELLRIETWADLKYMWARGFLNRIPSENMAEEESQWETFDQPVEYDLQAVT